MTKPHLWERYKQYLCICPHTGLRLDVSRMLFADGYIERMAAEQMGKVFREMEALETGAIANPDEGRMVGHYWLRNPGCAPNPELAADIADTLGQIKTFAGEVHSGRVHPSEAGCFENVLVVGIGGSALGPQLLTDALRSEADRMRVFFLDNTDPDGIDRTLGDLGEGLGRTLTLVISKSGGTAETRNGMVEAAHRYRRLGLDFGRHAVAVTGRGSALHRRMQGEKWLAMFPMWDWVGGRTSVTSAVGILPAALQGIDVDAFLAGAGDMDITTRQHEVVSNPAALMALMWYHAAEGRGAKDLVIIPYKDRVALLARYLQQLVMESLGKELGLDGAAVHQGLTVYGNKGSTDQHAYVQQLREGVHNFFVTFVEVVRDRVEASIEVEPGVTSGDYLSGFLLGTREALFEKGRASMTITLPELNARTLGAMIALYERTVGLYATLINVNAYHQPGVEAGKKAAGRVIELQRRILAALKREQAQTAEEIAAALDAVDEVETVYKVLEHLAGNPDRGVVKTDGQDPFQARYCCREEFFTEAHL
ncbi:MAG: glucose-6-phosphate isomerase [Phycisphaerae bacterium]|nr:glucose-6-phosphate isomerase [Phycisphaerae bacterium]